ncbi:hypothetical protein J4402_03600 [Candidatus Pacearchaeota archaeon]|nr:hypothetical protein [Candidatus Pacearchaeota archaeon]
MNREENKTGEKFRMKRKEFDYYIFIDYSESLIGYTIIEKSKIRDLLPKISKLAHYKEIVHKKPYLAAIRKRFEREEITKFLMKWKIRNMKENIEIFSDVLEFVKRNDNCAIFVSVDNNQYKSFLKLFEVFPHKENVEVSQESCLRKGSIECRLSYIIDNLLNIKRTKNA